MYALVDCNTFYSSCELIFRPDLQGKPVVVLSNNDGCIISRNDAAKALDIPELLPYFQIRERLEKLGCEIFSSNYELYGDISRRVMQLLEGMARDIEVYSIDEAFLRLERRDSAGYQAHGSAIRDMLLQQLSMPVCVGIAPTKTLAKLANRAAKKQPRFAGVCVLDEARKWEWLLERVSPKQIWGVGSRLTERLALLGIDNALQLARAEPKWLRKHFSVELERTARELNGEPCLNLETEPAPRKTVICTRSFSYKITELHELQQAISLYAERACEKLRNQHGLSEDLWVYLESMKPQGGYERRQNFVRLPHLSNDVRLISALAAAALEPIYRAGQRYKKCGIGLLDIRTSRYEQFDLFDSGQPQRSFMLMNVMDSVNQRYGKRTLQLASSGLQAPWSMSRSYLSPRYTTRWQDLPRVRC